MNGKALHLVLAITIGVVGLAAGFVTATWAMDDRMEAKIDRSLRPIQEDLREIKIILRQHFAPQGGGS